MEVKLTIRTDIDFIGQLRDGDVEAVLHAVQHGGVVLVGDERDGQALRAETARASDLQVAEVRVANSQRLLTRCR